MILVVGATGQVGSAVLGRLRERGEQVRALVRRGTDPAPITAIGAELVTGDLREPSSLPQALEGVDVVVATANTIVPRRGERADFDAVGRGHEELGRIARAAGISRLLFLSVPREFMGRGAIDFDIKGRVEDRLRELETPLTVVRSSLFMELWLPWLGSRLPRRGGRQATLERGFWLARLAGVAAQRSLDRFGIATLPGRGTARHAFIAVDDVAGALTAAAADPAGLADEVHLGGPEALSWREAAEAFARVLDIRLRTVRQPVAPFRALAAVSRPLSPAASQLLAAQTIVATVDSPFPSYDARRMLDREPTSVEAFLRDRRAIP